MGIFDRLKRVARAEISEMKRVLSEPDAPAAPQDAWAREEAERARLIREAEAELARDHDDDGDALTHEIEAGAALWRADPEPSTPAVGDPAIDRGAAAWGEVEPARGAPRYESRTHAFPREIREAYAALELPLGAPRADVDRGYRDMLHRYHPDKHAGDARRQALAHELTVRIREARDLLVTWLDSK